MTYDNFLMKEPYFIVCIPGALDPEHDTCCLQADGRLSDHTVINFMRLMANDGANAVRILSHDPGAPHYFENLKRMAAIAHRYRLTFCFTILDGVRDELKYKFFLDKFLAAVAGCEIMVMLGNNLPDHQVLQAMTLAKYLKNAGMPIENVIPGAKYGDGSKPPYTRVRNRLARMGYYSKELMMSRAVFYASPAWFEANVKKQHFRIRFFISDMLSERMTARSWEDCLSGFFKQSGRKPAANTAVSLRMGFETVIREKSHLDNVKSFSAAWRNYTSAFPRNYGQFPESGDPPDPDPDMPVDNKARMLELINELSHIVEASEFV